MVVDQLEEAFTLNEPDAARSFCSRLAAYATDVAPVIVTVRADHLASLGADQRFTEMAERGLHLVRPLAGDDLRAAIEGPAAQAGLRLEHGLVDLLVRDTEGEPGALPLLSHALAETWAARDGRVLTVDGYQATGGHPRRRRPVGRPAVPEPAARPAGGAALGDAAHGGAVTRR